MSLDLIRYVESPVHFILTRKFQYFTLLDCTCSSCTYNVSFRLNMSPIIFCGVECYPIFPCLNNEDFRHLYDMDKIFEAMTILQNFEIPESLIYYLQRETFGFQLYLDARYDGRNFINFDDYGDVVDVNSYPVNGKTHARIPIEGSIVVDSPSFAFTFPRIEHSLKPTILFADQVHASCNEEIWNANFLDASDVNINFNNKHVSDLSWKQNILTSEVDFDGYENRSHLTYPICLLWSINTKYKRKLSNERHVEQLVDKNIGPKPQVKIRYVI